MVVPLVLALAAFDAPIEVKTVALEGVRTLRCWRYPGVLVKQVDAQQKGAERLSFVAFRETAPTCERAAAASEKVLDDWHGAFAGALGTLLVFDGDDGWNGGIGFAVYDAATGRQVFTDARLGELSSKDDTLLYKRVVALDCNASATKRCAAKAKTLAATTQDLMAVCKKGYTKWLDDFQAEIAAMPCDAVCKRERKAQLDSFRGSDSVLAFDVSVDQRSFVITPRTKALECWLQN